MIDDPTPTFFRLTETLDWDHAAEKKIINDVLIPRRVLLPVEDSGWYAVMFEDGSDMGDYLGYFQHGLADARNVAGELQQAENEYAEGSPKRVVIYRLIQVEVRH